MVCKHKTQSPAESTQNSQSDVNVASLLATIHRLQAILNQTNTYIYTKNIDGQYTYVNQKTLEFLNLPLEDVIGKDDSYFFEPAMVNEWQLNDRLVIEQGETVSRIETIISHSTGEPRILWTVKSPLYDLQGQIIGVVGIASDITEQKKIEDELTSSKSKLEAALASMNDAVFISDVEGNFVEFNEAFAICHRFRNKSECLQKLIDYPEILEVYSDSGELLPLERWAIPRALRGESATNVEFTLRRKDTGETWVGSYSFAPIRNEQGVIVGSVSTGRDITELKRIELALQKSRYQLETIIKQSPFSIAMFDQRMNYLAVSDRWLMEFFSEYRDIIGQNHYEVFPDLPERWKMVHQQGLAGIFQKNDEDLWIREDGTEHWSRWTVAPWFDETGKIGGIIITSEDITERKQAEHQIRIAATAFESQEGMVITDAIGNILRVNRAFSDITGYSAEDVIGKHVRSFKSRKQDKAFYVAMWECILSTGAWIGEVQNRHKNGKEYAAWLSITAVKNVQGEVTNYVGTLRDISESKNSEIKIRQLAYYDPLTQLANRSLLYDRIKQAFAVSARSNRFGALLFIDLDNFKLLNDTLGHDVGDQLLQQVAKRLQECVREGDTVSRIGGDEFVILLENLSSMQAKAVVQSESIGKKILSSLSSTYLLGNYSYVGTPSIGFSLFKGHDNSVESLLKQADIAMYQAKASGRNTMCFFDQNMQDNVTRRAVMENDLREAIKNNQFLLYYQAQVDEAQNITGAEVLIRWQHPTRGIVSPAEFILLAEETGLILPIGQWVLEMACLQLVTWGKQVATSHLQLAVNVSIHQFQQPDFVKQTLDTLAYTGVEPSRLKLEVTESLLAEDIENIIDKMLALKSVGLSFSLDDFGTGYSSLSYLKKLPLGQLKIDQSFVRDVLNDPNDATIARTIIALAQSMGLSVIAEGVETKEQRDFLVANGCHYYQGYLFSKPIPIEQFEVMIGRSINRI